jgi:toxin YoeB
VRIVFTPTGWEDYTFWQRTDRKLLVRINRLIEDASRDPYGGIGKPERLRYTQPAALSRRINDEHRMVYLVQGEDLIIVQARYHYER